MEQDRALEKIKKCLEMAKGKNANANEAETALRQAHKMMEAYNVEMGDVLASMASEAAIYAGSDGNPPAWRGRLAQVCGHAFGTHLIINKVARGDAFAHSWIDAVYGKVDEFAGVDEGIEEAIKAYMDKKYPDLATAKMKRRKLKARDESASNAGYLAGQSAQLHTAVAASARPLAIGGTSA